MQVEVSFAGEQIAFEVPADRLVQRWSGPAGTTVEAFRARVFEALERPLDFPPLRQTVVPGDRVVIPVTPGMPAAGAVLGAMMEILERAGVEPGAVTILTAESAPELFREGTAHALHDPRDRRNWPTWRAPRRAGESI